MNRMIGLGDACTSSMTWRRRFSNSPFMLAPACSRPTSSARSDTSLQRRRHVARGDAQREAFDHRRLADARLAGEDRIVLPAAHQDVDDLADLLVAADDRIDLALARLLGQVDGEAASAPPACPSAPAPSRRSPRPAPRRRQAGAVAAPQRVFRRAADDRGEVVGQRLRLDLLELARDARAARCAGSASSACRRSGGRCAPALSPNISVP